MKRILLLMIFIVSVACFFAAPEMVSEGARQGLLLWFDVILPALLPFMIFSGVILQLGIASSIGQIIYPVMHRLFRITRNGCYPIVIGMMSGYPLGAKTVADLYQNNEISKREGQFLLGICNNVSPMFLLEYIGIYCLGMRQPAWEFLIVYGSAFVAAFCSPEAWKMRRESVFDEQRLFNRRKQTSSFMEALDHSILDAFLTLAKVGGYIVLFSILTQIFKTVIYGNSFPEVLGMGILEITTGGEGLRGYSGSLWLKWVAAMGICAFGGCSSIAQTASVIHESGLSIKRYIVAKIRHGLMAALLAALIWGWMGGL